MADGADGKFASFMPPLLAAHAHERLGAGFKTAPAHQVNASISAAPATLAALPATASFLNVGPPLSDRSGNPHPSRAAQPFNRERAGRLLAATPATITVGMTPLRPLPQRREPCQARSTGLYIRNAPSTLSAAVHLIDAQGVLQTRAAVRHPSAAVRTERG